MVHYAVLTGDIIGSSALSAFDLDSTMRAIKQQCRDIAEWTGDPKSTYFARRGGDSWQIALRAPQFALRAAIAVQARVMALPFHPTTRIAIAVGTGNIPDTGDINAAHGAVFTDSGRLLSTLDSGTRMGDARGGARHAAAILADHVAQGWTPTQARAIAAALAPNAPTQSVIAKDLGVSRQSVNQTLKAAGYSALTAALAAIEEHPSETDK
ncbi:hypothetical protein [Marivita hallyeonensis]|uniref:SatD family (SatD) n=1 Tax=Marivita hallyeonensis TaxID=996342 RepID=A0A1M5RE87_9RHOB|nr:hypothetical protein [Marivita hallyeonensis]SHH24339.1 hypothetical protein SAMN05443551_1719 [Marivita hallyeonensis]